MDEVRKYKERFEDVENVVGELIGIVNNLHRRAEDLWAEVLAIRSKLAHIEDPEELENLLDHLDKIAWEFHVRKQDLDDCTSDLDEVMLKVFSEAD